MNLKKHNKILAEVIVLLSLIIVSLCLFIYFHKPVVEQVIEYKQDPVILNKIDSLMQDNEKSYQKIDSLSEAIKVKQKTRIIYINNNQDAHARIDTFSSHTVRHQHLDSIYSNRFDY